MIATCGKITAKRRITGVQATWAIPVVELSIYIALRIRVVNAQTISRIPGKRNTKAIAVDAVKTIDVRVGVVIERIPLPIIKRIAVRKESEKGMSARTEYS